MSDKRFYEGNPNVKADGVVEEFTPELLEEYKKCMEDPVYFCLNYVKVINLDEGLVPFDLYPYQHKMFDHFQNNRFNIVLACRQSGKTVACVGYLLWYALFHSEKTIAILANKGATARSILGRVKLAIENIPFFLQPGTKAFNEGRVAFSNNTKILAASTSNSSIRGESINLLYLDEFAFVDRDAEFYTSTYPVVTAGKTTQVIITSTANGIGNTYHKLWTGALQRSNSYMPFRVDWWDVPGRDSDWKKETIGNTSVMQFNQEYGNQFYGSGDTLINANTLMRLQKMPPIEILEEGSMMVYDEVEKDHQYIMTVDVSKGLGQDYSAFSIIDVTRRPMKQVAVYRNNDISPILFPTIIEKYATVYNKAFVVVENNDQGALVLHGLYHDLEYDEIFMKSAVKNNGLGQDMNRKVKRIGCSGFKDILENNRLEVEDEQTILEISTFEAKGQSYEASNGNTDDIVMTLVMFGYFVTTNQFLERTDIDIKNYMYEQRIKEIEDDVPPFGFIDDGLGGIPAQSLEEPYDPWSIQTGTRLEIEDW
jgi:hypothetical protein